MSFLRRSWSDGTNEHLANSLLLLFCRLLRSAQHMQHRLSHTRKHKIFRKVTWPRVCPPPHVSGCCSCTTAIRGRPQMGLCAYLPVQNQGDPPLFFFFSSSTFSSQAERRRTGWCARPHGDLSLSVHSARLCQPLPLTHRWTSAHGGAARGGGKALQGSSPTSKNICCFAGSLLLCPWN